MPGEPLGSTSRTLAANSPKRAAFAAGIIGQLELPHTMRLQPVSTPDPLHRTDADAARLGHGRGGPVRGFARRISQGQRHHLRRHLLIQRWDARRARFVAQQAVHTGLHEALLPPPDRGLGYACLPHDLVGARSRGRQQHDAGTPDMLLRAVAVRDNRFQTSTVSRSDLNDEADAHRPDSHATSQTGTPDRTLPSDFIH